MKAKDIGDLKFVAVLLAIMFGPTTTIIIPVAWYLKTSGADYVLSMQISSGLLFALPLIFMLASMNLKWPISENFKREPFNSKDETQGADEQ